MGLEICAENANYTGKFHIIIMSLGAWIILSSLFFLVDSLEALHKKDYLFYSSGGTARNKLRLSVDTKRI